MRILIVDDEKIVLEDSADVVRAVCPDAEIICAQKSSKAIGIIEEKHIDIALLDIEMPQTNGLALAKLIREKDPQTNIIFVTAYTKYALDAFGMYVSGYLLKPLQESEFAEALKNLRRPVSENDPAGDKINNKKEDNADENRLRIQCFGNFEVYKGNEVVAFPRTKSKELFAYLVSLKGAAANTSELCAVLWEDSVQQEKNRHYLRNLMSNLKKTLNACDALDVLVVKRNQFSIATDKVDCDYYRFLQRDAAAVNEYRGEFMNQYSWAEFISV